MAYHPYCEPKDPKPNPYGSMPETEPVVEAPPLPEPVVAPEPVEEPVEVEE